jgi:hypothetical protein
MVLLTRESAEVVSDMPAEFYLKDDDIFYLVCFNEHRIKFLEEMGKDSMVVDRLGRETEPDSVFERREVELGVPTLPFKKEMGYHHRP